MLSLYLAAASCGLILLIATIFLGDSDLDADTDLDLDPDIDFDAEVDFNIDGAGELDAMNTAEKKGKQGFLPFLSIRFWTFGLTVFGVTGIILVKMNQPTAIHASLAIGMGLIVGWAAAQIFHRLKNTTVDSSADVDRLRGTEALVVLTVRPGGTGKVRMRVKEQDVEVTATTSHDSPLEIGDRVLIVESANGQVVVAPFPSVDKE